MSAWTSILCPPEHGAALCGWLLPGPCSFVVGAAPFFAAICPAVAPLPYCFVSLDCASACVSCTVSLDGLTPTLATGALGSAAVVVTAGAVSASFFNCPGAFAELPGAESLAPAFPFPFPFPLPAYAGTANTRTLRTSTPVPVSRMVIPPPHVSR